MISVLRSGAKLQFLQYAQGQFSCDVGMAQIKNRHFWGIGVFFIFFQEGRYCRLVGRLSQSCFVKKADEIYL